jgi:hypothetical protein
MLVSHQVQVQQPPGMSLSHPPLACPRTMRYFPGPMRCLRHRCLSPTVCLLFRLRRVGNVLVACSICSRTLSQCLSASFSLALPATHPVGCSHDLGSAPTSIILVRACVCHLTSKAHMKRRLHLKSALLLGSAWQSEESKSLSRLPWFRVRKVRAHTLH